MGSHRWPGDSPNKESVTRKACAYLNTIMCKQCSNYLATSLVNTYMIARFMWSTWSPPGSYWPQMGPILATWTLLSGIASVIYVGRANGVYLLKSLDVTKVLTLIPFVVCRQRRIFTAWPTIEIYFKIRASICKAVRRLLVRSQCVWKWQDWF